MSQNEIKDINIILKEYISAGSITCPEAFSLVNEYSIFPDILGLAFNSNKIKLKGCQLGLFGHGDSKIVRPSETVSEELENKIIYMLEDDKMPCAAAWTIASEMKISKLEVACACEKLKIKIFKCQLGAF
jgi:hypothetical protein